MKVWCALYCFTRNRPRRVKHIARISRGRFPPPFVRITAAILRFHSCASRKSGPYLPQYKFISHPIKEIDLKRRVTRECFAALLPIVYQFFKMFSLCESLARLAPARVFPRSRDRIVYFEINGPCSFLLAHRGGNLLLSENTS